MRSKSQLAPWFIGLIAVCGLLMLGSAAVKAHLTQPVHTAVLLLLALLTARMKVKLPGINGNMSVNLPFILIAVAQLSTLEALVVALAATAAQCFPKGSGKLNAAQMVFNLGTAAIAVGVGGWLTRLVLLGGHSWPLPALLLVVLGASFLLLQTVPVATIVLLTEGGKIGHIWSSIFHLSFPYYVLSVGVSSLMSAASQRLGWQIPLLTLPVMYGVYHSYKLYFSRMAPVAFFMELNSLRGRPVDQTQCSK